MATTMRVAECMMRSCSRGVVYPSYANDQMICGVAQIMRHK
jgi:hypothetical protein